jgi:hypothetical protein
MNTIFRVEHIYGQQIYTTNDINELSKNVKIRKDGDLNKVNFENEGVIEIADVELDIVNIKARIDGETLIITVHVEG